MRRFRGHEFYIYLLFSSEFPRIPFYAGKGCGDRDRHHYMRRNSHKGYVAKYIKEVCAQGHSLSIKRVFSGLEEDQAFRIERQLIALFGRRPNGVLINRSAGGQGISGLTVPPERRERIAAALRGIPWDAAKKARHAISQKEVMNRPEVKEKMRKTMTGRKLAPSHCAAISAGLIGKPKSEADKAKNGAAYAANGRSEACRTATSRANTGKVRSARHRTAISVAHKGKPKSPEQRYKISESNKRTKARVKAVKMFTQEVIARAAS